MKKTILTMLLCAGMLSLAGCSQGAQESGQQTSAVQQTENSAGAYNLLEDSYTFEMLWNIATGPSDGLQIGRDMTNAYPGMPFRAAGLEADGTAALIEKNVYFPVICDQEAVALLQMGDGSQGASISFAPELTAYLQNGGKAAIVISGGAVYAIGEDDSAVLLTETPGEASAAPALTFEEASGFNNVVSLDSLTQEFKGENSDEILTWIYGE